MSEYKVDFGTSARFVTAKMIDADGNEMLCKCGNAATSGIIGKEAYVLRCSTCSPFQPSIDLIFEPPKGVK